MTTAIQTEGETDWHIAPKPISELPPNGVDVLLLRRTGNGNVKTSVGCRWAGGAIRGWFGVRPPTHYVELPPFPVGILSSKTEAK